MRMVIKQKHNEYNQLLKKNENLEKKANLQRQELLNNITMEEFAKLTYKFCESKEFADFIIVQLKLMQNKPKGRRYSFEFKRDCLALYFTSPKLYKQKLMQKFSLPNPSTLFRFVQHFQLNTGFNNPQFLAMLKCKIDNFNERNRFYILCVDEMTIKSHLFYCIGDDRIVGFEDYGPNHRTFKPASTATVLLVRGVYSKWSQPLSFFFSHTTCPGYILKNILFEAISQLKRIGLTVCGIVSDMILFEAISQLKRIGLTVCGIVSDMGSNNMQVAHSLQITPEKPYFHVNEEKIVYMFDTPHLIKALRNNLLKYKFVSEEKEIRWDYITQFYNNDKKYGIRAAPKLTDSHIQPTNFEKMKVKYATQVFSATVSAGLNLYIRFGAIPAAAIATAEFIDKIDKCFDLLNSSSTSSPKQYNRAFKGLDFQLFQSGTENCEGDSDAILLQLGSKQTLDFPQQTQEDTAFTLEEVDKDYQSFNSEVNKL
ncbi:Transposase protein [Popillia japonica]|uniref:Transposase protein n=1 Tax=Popillia japonica TaxID=7064 RepID=A0AAW1JY67_POPJA